MKMNFIWIPIGLLLITWLPNGIHSQSDENSLIDPKINLDPKLRKALLKVLTNLDDEDNNQNSRNDKEENIDNENSETENNKPIVKNVYNVHSFSADQSTETIPANQNNGEEEIKFIISKKHTPIELEPDTIVAGSTDLESRAAKSNLLSDINKNNFVTSKPDNDLKTPLPTAQTETDGLNSDNGKVEEVQFFSAPLVAAFTVHQDELGLPHSVIPLYKDDSKINKQRDISKDTSGNSVTNSNSVLRPIVNIGTAKFEKPSLFQQQLFQLYKERQEQQEALLQQRQRQRELDEQRRLQEQQRLLQIRLKEEELRRQQQLREQEHQRRQQLYRQQQNSFSNSQFVSFQPSISTANSQQPFLVQQQLPNREAVDFLTSLRQQNLQDLPLQQNHIPLNFNQALHPLQQIESKSPSFNNLAFTESAGLNSNRVFRQEQQTGNFGSNQNSVNFRQQPSIAQNSFQDFRQLQAPVQNSINDFRQSAPIDFRQQPTYTLADRQLKNLLYQSGLYQTSNGQQEDLNIVSKILSLNHFGGQFNGVLRRSDDSNIIYFKN